MIILNSNNTTHAIEVYTLKPELGQYKMILYDEETRKETEHIIENQTYDSEKGTFTFVVETLELKNERFYDYLLTVDDVVFKNGKIFATNKELTDYDMLSDKYIIKISKNGEYVVKE